MKNELNNFKLEFKLFKLKLKIERKFHHLFYFKYTCIFSDEEFLNIHVVQRCPWRRCRCRHRCRTAVAMAVAAR
jgi:hypothetical protein